MSQQAGGVKWVLGLDIGIASVGWCVRGDTRVVDLGVYCFDKAETADGEPLNAVRRSARLVRNRLRGRAARLRKLARTLKREGLIADAKFFVLQKPFVESLWKLRRDGLDRRLGDEEWARVIYHICKHRGFHFPRKSEADASEGGRVKKGLERTRELMRAKAYRTLAEMALSEYSEHQRNKRGDYGQSLPREMLADELAQLFAGQRQLGNPHASERFEAEILDAKTGILWQQKPALTADAMLKLLGKCTFERDEYRAAKHTWTAERFVWLSRLNNLRLSIDGTLRPLDDVEREAVVDLPYTNVSVKYLQIKQALIKRGLISDSARFVGLRYPSQQAGETSKDPEEAKVAELKGWHTLRKAFAKAGLETEWRGLSGDHEKLDRIASTLTLCKSDDEIRRELAAMGLPAPMVEALLGVSFSGFLRLSLKALGKIIAPMERGERYDQACESAGYRHSTPQASSVKTSTLPSFYAGRDRDGKMLLDDGLDAPRNPVVLRALNQARKVVNALIREYGSPERVHIEMARDLSRSLDERYKIEKEQKAYAERNQALRKQYESEIGSTAKAREFEKWRLYHEQNGQCAYSLEALDLNRVVDDPSYAEVDHVLPYSRSYDDSKANKVLVLKRENQQKGNRTPYEYLDGANDSERWQRFEAVVRANPQYRQAKRDRLLRKHFGKDEAAEFKERNLNDTRYICRFFKNFVERHLQLAGGDRRCVVLSGQLTAFLRARWGLRKVRDESDRHHALDAAVVASCEHGMVKRLSDYSRARELRDVRDGYRDAETGEVVDIVALRRLEQQFPMPWLHFREELEARLHIDTPEALRERLARLGTYDDEALRMARPLFVARAVKRRNGGAAHKETIYSQPAELKETSSATKKVALASLKIADFDKLVDPQRNEKLYKALRKRFDEFGAKADKAFPPGYEFRKPDKQGNPTGPIVRTVTLLKDKITGVDVRGGMAENDSMLRIDVFSKGGKFFLVPVYVRDRVAKTLPNRAIVGGKDERDWTNIDGTYKWCFSLYPNDLVRVTTRDTVHFGYYAGCDRSTAAVSLWVHDRDKNIGKDGLIRSIGVKTAKSVERFHVDVLGRIYRANPEPRRELA